MTHERCPLCGADRSEQAVSEASDDPTALRAQVQLLRRAAAELHDGFVAEETVATAVYRMCAACRAAVTGSGGAGADLSLASRVTHEAERRAERAGELETTAGVAPGPARKAG